MNDKISSKTEKHAGMIFVITFLSGLLLAAAIYGINFFLTDHQIYFRTWVYILASMIVWYLLPCSLMVYLMYLLLVKREDQTGKKGMGKPVIKNVCAFILGIVLIGYVLVVLFFQVLFFSSTYESEKRIGALLVGTRNDNILDSTILTKYYDAFNFFTKTVSSDDAFIIQTLMEERYQESFVIRQIEEKEGYTSATGAFEGLPEIEVHVVKSGSSHGAYQDDATMARVWMYLENYSESNGLGSRIMAEYSEGLLTDIKIYCAYEEWELCAEQAAGAIASILEDHYFAQGEHRSFITVVCGEQENYYNTLRLGFGGEDQYGTAGRYYADENNVYQVFYETFYENIHAYDSDAAAEGMLPKTEPEEEGTEKESTEEESTVDESKTAVQDEKAAVEGGNLTTPEGAFAKLYETIFAAKPEDAGQGGYIPNYNAKGNFYVLLEQGEKELDGELMQTAHTVVYDRLSANGKCQLFVEYLDYMQGNGTERSVYSTQILEFYAVNMMTGEVVAANKTAWDQVAVSEYREMTGE